MKIIFKSKKLLKDEVTVFYLKKNNLMLNDFKGNIIVFSNK